MCQESLARIGAGGIGILIGDGRQTYGAEKVLETYYSMRVNPTLTLAVNYQHVSNPAYNRDRGPVSIFGIRAHAEFWRCRRVKASWSTPPALFRRSWGDAAVTPPYK